MTVLPLVYAPNDIFKEIAQKVVIVNDEVRSLIDSMFETIYHYQAVGMGASMIGLLERIAIVDLQEDEDSIKYSFINPEITWYSDEMQVFTEGSICFPGISADVTRPKAIKIKYLNYYGEPKELLAEGWLATVIQHEVDYLNGKVFLDYLSKMKRDMLMKKLEKARKFL